MEKIEIKVALTVLKPHDEVFEAIVNPEKMSNYFIAESTGPMEEGVSVTWKFPEFDLQFPILIDRVEKNKYISYYWDDEKGNQTMVEIKLEAKGEQKTTVRISEKSRDINDEGISWYGRNTEGWANFLACLKAWLEYGINLRKGAFDIGSNNGN